MNTSEIERILEKYYDGRSSLEEENILREFFMNEEVPSHLQIHAGQFRYFSEASREQITDPGFDERFFTAIDDTPVIELKSNRNRIFYITGLAATVLLLVGIFLTLQKDVINNSVTKPGNQNTELAFQQTEEILMFVSANFNKGIDEFQHLGEFDKAVQKVQMISKFYQFQTSIINPEPFKTSSIKSDNQ